MFPLILHVLMTVFHEALALHTASTAAPLQLDFTVSKTAGNGSSREFWTNISRKRDAVAETIFNSRDLIYLVNVYVGFQKQKFSVALDTGSSDLWVPENAYYQYSSKSFYDSGEPFSISYMDGATMEGHYVFDRLQLESENAVLPNFRFARAGGDSMGVLGIADRYQEASMYPYDNLPWALYTAGITPKASYSLFLGPSQTSGSLIFGGIDTEKYVGELQKYRINTSTGGLAVDVDSVTIGGRTFSVNAPAILDCGTSLGLLNGELMNELDGIFNTTTFQQDGIEYRIASCDQPRDKNLEFHFGRNSIVLSYADAVVGYDNGTCLLGFAYHENRQILGDVFLRKAYVHFDLSEQTISLAQASYSGSSNIVSA